MGNEIWKDVKGYEGYYQVSSMGRVKSKRALMASKDGTIRQKDILLATRPTREKQYITIALCVKGVVKQAPVHRLVAEAFIPNPDNLPCVNHKDENPSNNWVGNLEWCTQRYNLQYSLERKGSKRPKKELIPLCAYTLNGEFVGRFDSVWVAIEKLGIESKTPRGVRNNIRRCCEGKSKSAFGYTWRYDDGKEYPQFEYQKPKIASVPGNAFLKALRKLLLENKATISSASDVTVRFNGKSVNFGRALSAQDITKKLISK